MDIPVENGKGLDWDGLSGPLQLQAFHDLCDVLGADPIRDEWWDSQRAGGAFPRGLSWQESHCKAIVKPL